MQPLQWDTWAWAQLPTVQEATLGHICIGSKADPLTPKKDPWVTHYKDDEGALVPWTGAPFVSTEGGAMAVGGTLGGVHGRRSPGGGPRGDPANGESGGGGTGT